MSVWELSGCSLGCSGVGDIGCGVAELVMCGLGDPRGWDDGVHFYSIACRYI